MIWCTSRTLPLYDYQEPLSELASPSEWLHYPDPKRNSPLHRESLGRHDVPKREVADPGLEAAGPETGPDSQAGPELKLEPDLTKAELDLGPDLLDRRQGPEQPRAEPG